MRRSVPSDCARLNLSTVTWFGLPVEISVSARQFHYVAVPGLAIPHFGLVNLVARQGLPEDIRLALTARHELGHLQTLPVPLLHLALLLFATTGPPVWVTSPPSAGRLVGSPGSMGSGC